MAENNNDLLNCISYVRIVKKNKLMNTKIKIKMLVIFTIPSSHCRFIALVSMNIHYQTIRVGRYKKHKYLNFKKKYFFKFRAITNRGSSACMLCCLFLFCIFLISQFIFCRMVISCSAFGCTNRAVRGKEHIRFHR